MSGFIVGEGVVISAARRSSVSKTIYAAAFLAVALTGGAGDLWAQAQFPLKVDISGLRNYKGNVIIYLWADTEENSKFPDPAKVQFRDERITDEPCDFPKVALCRRTIQSLQNITASFTFKNVPAGDYAIFVIHDENANGVMDTGFMGRALEARGYSQVLPDDVNPVAARIRFRQAKFGLLEPKSITIGLRYPPRW